MLQKLALLAVALVTPLVIVFPASAEPAQQPDAPQPLPEAVMLSRPPGFLHTRDGWDLTIGGSNETVLAVQPLTTNLASREYLVGGTFIATAEGGDESTLTGGTLDVGYRIGCGIAADVFDIAGTVGVVPSISSGLKPGSGFPSLSGTLRLHLRPGVVNIVSVGKKAFKGAGARMNINGVRIKIDSCAGQSFIQSYATFGSSTTDTEDIVTYTGNVKVV